MSGVISSLIRWIWSFSISLRFFRRRSVKHRRAPGIERGDRVVEIAVLALQELELHPQHLLARHRGGVCSSRDILELAGLYSRRPRA